MNNLQRVFSENCNFYKDKEHSLLFCVRTLTTVSSLCERGVNRVAIISVAVLIDS